MSEITLATLGLTEQGISECTELFYNVPYRELFAHETDPTNEGFERGTLTNLDAIEVDTGIYTGRSPKDKYIVEEDISRETVWWAEDGSDNHRLSETSWAHLKDITLTELGGKKLYVMDGFCGANPSTRMAVRLVTEVAWMAHFFKNMFIRPTEDELKNFVPDWTIFNACKTSCKNPEQWGLRSETYVAFHLKQRMTVIGGTWYGGEIKKGIFSIMNYFLPLEGVGAFHCSANEGKDGDTALFFGLSGTGKTTLSADPHRALIGDDEHGWDETGVFNFEGGCYAKTIDLSEENEPDIYRAIRRDALLENVALDENGTVDFHSSEKTQNTRVSYPIYHIDNIVKPVSRGGHPQRIIFLTCDAYGVLPPVSRLTKEQAMYQYLSGYTAKVAGTELGITEPTACFSACFGQPFLLLHPTKYADILGRKMDEHNAKAYLVNTGWTGGPYGVGKRISIKNTRAIIDRILDGSIDDAEMEVDEIFSFEVPVGLEGVQSHILHPRTTWQDKAGYDVAAHRLAQQFVENFGKFAGTESGMRLMPYGPRIIVN
jgi:phosphoenolpyruvate carboxykinase (ATP)